MKIPSLVTAAITAAILPSLAAQGPSSLFPDSAYVVVEVAGLDALERQAGNLAFGELLRGVFDRMDEQAREGLVGRAMQGAIEELDGVLGELELTPRQVQAVLSRPIALAIGRPVFFDDELVPSVGVAFAGNPEEVGAALGRFEAMLTSRARLSAENTEIGGVAARRIFNERRSGEVIHGQVGGFSLVTNSSHMFGDCVHRPAGGVAQTATGGGEVLASVSVRSSAMQPVIPLLEAFLPYGFESLPEILGIEQIEDIQMVSIAERGGCYEKTEIGLRGSPKGIFKACMSQPADLGAAGWCGEDTVLFGSMSMDLLGVAQGVQRLLDGLPARMRAEVVGEIKHEVARELGMNLDSLHQLVASFGTNVSFAVETYQREMIPTVTLFVDAAEPERVAGLMAQVEGMVAQEADSTWKDLKIGGGVEGVIRYTQLQIDGQPLRIGYTVHGGRLVICSDAKKLRTAARRFARQEASLAQVASFAEAQQRFGGAGVLFHTRMDRAAELGWPMAEGPLRAWLDSEEMQRGGLSSAMMPEVDEVARGLGTSTFAITVNEGGFVFEQRSNIGIGALLCFAGKFLEETLEAMSPQIR